MIRIMIVDDHELVRFGLKRLLELQSGWQVVTEAGTVAEAIHQANAHQPDVIVMDIRLNDGNGIDACRAVVKTCPQTKVIMLTSSVEDDLVLNAISAGAVGYVLKQVINGELIRAIAKVARGETLFDSRMPNQVLADLREATRPKAFADLTKQELQVLALVAHGKSNKEVAEKLHLGEGTIRNYLTYILSKLNLTNRAEAIAYAVRHHLDDYMNTLK